MNIKTYFGIWIVLILFELGYLMDLTQRVHDPEDTLVIIVIIVVTLVVGNTFLRIVKK